MGCAQVSAASQRHPTAPLSAKRPPCSTPTALATGLAPPRTLPAKGGAKRPAVHHCRRGRVGAAGGKVGRLCSCGCVWNVPRGRDATMPGAHRSSPEQSPTCRARAESPAEQNKEQRTTARRPHSSQQGRDHHDTQRTAYDDSFSLWSQTWVSLLASRWGPSSTGLHAGRGISSKQSKQRSKQAAPPSHIVRLRHLELFRQEITDSRA